MQSLLLLIDRRIGTGKQSTHFLQKNVLLKALGPEAQVEGQFLQQTLSPGDMLLLCTDGLYNYVEYTTAIPPLPILRINS